MFSTFRTKAIGAAALARLRNVLTAAAAVLFSALLSSLPARAGLIFDLTVSSAWTGSGSIDLTTASGTSTADVAAFSFHVATGFGSPQDYTLADIATISWSIDSAGDLSLLLLSNLIPFASDQSAIILTNESGIHTDPCASGLPARGSQTCVKFSVGSDDTAGGTLTATRVAAVPEPASLPLLAVGLASLGMVLRTRRARPT